MRSTSRIMAAIFLCFGLIASDLAWSVAPKAGAKKHDKTADQKLTFEEIIQTYTIVADFNVKEPERPISDELFWRYPWKLPEIEFPFFPEFEDQKKEIPPTAGAGRAFQHLNQGRALFLEGKLEEARTTWLSGRARYGKDYAFHRRNDYFIGYVFFKQALEDMKARKVTWTDEKVKGAFSNASTFMSWAFLMKKDEADPVVDYAMPKGLFNLASIYFRYKRYAGAYGAATKGLEFLRVTGRKEFRPFFRRLIAESYVQNRSYLEAMQELDVALRQDPDKRHAAAIFMRIGDLYFDLNNYELAEELYGLSGIIDEEMRQITPSQLILRGESLFWLGRFNEAQRVFHYALEGVPFRKTTAQVSMDFSAYAKLRYADAFLAMKRFDEAKLAYFQVDHEFRGTEAARIARVRQACLELPFYLGNNVRHGRELLDGLKESADIPIEARELAWACNVSSYSERERTFSMLERVRVFSDRFPESRFLKSMAGPIREVQAGRIDTLFAAGDGYSAISFFEKNRKHLFPKVADDLAQKLFRAYVNTYASSKAKEFWAAHSRLPETDTKVLREAVAAAEIADAGKGAEWLNRSEHIAHKLKGRRWKTAPDGQPRTYLIRLLNSPTSNRFHMPWIFELTDSWAAASPENLCEYQFPVVTRILDQNPKMKPAAALKMVDAMVARGLPRLLETDETCAASILELEARVLKSDQAELSRRYSMRRLWPMTQPVLAQLWSLSENLYELGDKKGADELWRLVRDKGPADSPEVGFAKSRLDPNRTEFENLWK